MIQEIDKWLEETLKPKEKKTFNQKEFPHIFDNEDEEE